MSKQKSPNIGLKESVSLLLRGFRIINGYGRNVLLSQTLKSIFNALYPFINIYLSAQIINELLQNRDLNRLILLVCVTVGANLLCFVLKSLLTRWEESKSHLYWWQHRLLLSSKLRSMDFVDAEDPKIRNTHDTIRMHAEGMGYGLSRIAYDGISSFVVALTQIIASVSLAFGMFFQAATKDGFLWLNSVWANVLVLAAIVGSIVVWTLSSAKISRMYASSSEDNNQSNRKFRFYMGEILETKRQRDVRLYRQDKAIDVNENPGFDIFLKLNRQASKLYSISTVVLYLFNGVIFLFAACKALGGAFAVGSAVQYVSAATQFIAGINALISALNDWRANMPYLRNALDFLDIPNRKYLGSLSVEKRDDNEYEIEFHDVSFRYPGAEDYALKHLNLKFKIGERMAVVGENGSGKSTMIKLLCRLYDPTEGKITLNGIDIKKYDYDQYMAIFGVVFQDFALMPFTLGENVATQLHYDREKATECLQKAGFGDRLSAWDKGLDTYLYKEFSEEGVDISGGEAQKIALARALYKDAPFIVLDEPTAALDPVSEFEIYSKFNDIVEDKTAIYISHRLSSCRFCEDIAVFDKGELIQRGSHESLLADTEGKYYALWNAQAQYYATEPAQ